MSIQKPTHISQHLQDLIDTANNSIQTIKEQILEIYETAKKEGFTPQEARILIEEKVIKISDRHLRRILPDESKRTYIKSDNSDIGPKLEDSQENDDKDVNIPYKYTIKQAEIGTETEIDLPEPTQELPNDDFDSSQDVTYDKDLVDRYVKQISNLESEIAKLNKEVIQLRMQKVGTFGNKFEFHYSFEMPSGDFVPFIVTVFPDKKDGYIRLDKEEIKRIKEKEAKRK